MGGIRRRGKAVAVVVVAVAAAGCGTNSPRPSAVAHHLQGSPRQLVMRAAATTESAKSADMALDMTVSGSPDLGALGMTAQSGTTSAPVNISIKATGAFDFASKDGSMTMTMPAEMGGSTVEMRIIGQTLYMRAPQLLDTTGGKPWISIDYGSYVKQLGVSSLTSGSPDPTQYLSWLQKLGASVTEVGTGTIDGVSATHYRSSLDMAKIFSGASTSTGQDLAQMYKAMGLSSVPLDVWIDSQGRLVHMSIDMSFLGMKMQVAMSLSHFGTPVNVVAPPASEVADGSNFLGQIGSILGASGLSNTGSGA